MPVGFCLIAILFHGLSSVPRLVLWVVSIAVTMVPWLLYTRNTVGAPLLTSTNGGHVLYIGLGQLPNNPWGITGIDNDPAMRAFVDARFGEEESTAGSKADGALRAEFRRLVAEHPVAYVRKMLHSFNAVLTEGGYPGEFVSLPEPGNAKLVSSRCKSALLSPVDYIREYGLAEILKTYLLIASFAFSLVVVFASNILLLPNGIFALLRKDFPALMIVATVFYTTLLQCATFQMRTYSNAVLVFHIINIAFAVSYIIGFRLTLSKTSSPSLA